MSFVLGCMLFHVLELISMSFKCCFFANSFNAAKVIDSGMQSHLFVLHEQHGSELYHNGTCKTSI